MSGCGGVRAADLGLLCRWMSERLGRSCMPDEIDFPWQIGQYRIERELGRGAMGVVFEAVDTFIGRRVALKLILQNGNPHDPEYQEARRRFLQEGRSAGALSHPHIVTIYQVGEYEAQVFMAMEFVEGESLDRFLRTHARMPPEKAVHVLRCIALALDHAHAHSVIHRDVKPANILQANDGTVKLTDFGIAKSLEQTALTRPGFVLGTAAYMSPEQIRGASLTGRSDQFSLAIVAHELLSGTRPFDADDPTGVCYQIVHEPPRPLALTGAAFTQEVAAVVERALAKDPDGRFPSCAAFVEQLEIALRRAGLLFKEQHKKEQQPRLWALLTLGMAVVVGGISYRACDRLGPVAQERAQTNVTETTPATAARPDTTARPGAGNAPADNQSRRSVPPGPSKLEPPSSSKDESSAPVEVARTIPAPQPVQPAGDGPPLRPQWAMVNGSPAQSGGASSTGPASARVQWSFPVESAVRGSVVISGDGTAYFGDQAGVLHGVRGGTEVWTHRAKGGIVSSPVLLDKGLIVATMEPRILSVRHDGTPGWSLPISNEPTASLIEHNGAVLVGSTDGNAYAIKDGRRLWMQDIGGPVRHTISANRELVYVATGSTLRALNAETGEPRWSHDFDEDIAAAPSSRDGRVYVTTSKGHLYALSHSGRVEWSYKAAAPILTSPSLHPNGAILFGCADRSVYAVRDADLLWKAPTGGPVRTSPIIDRNGVAYFGSSDGNFYAIGADGQPEWTLNIGSEPAAPAALGSDGTLFVATRSRAVVALR